MNAPFLIADDSREKIAMLETFLKRAQWEGPILIAMTTDDAKRLIDENPDIGFAFVDYYMPTENGPAVMHYLKSSNPSARIALVSSGNKKSNSDEAMAAGAEACVCTSERGDEVEEMVMGLLEEWRNEK